MSKGKKDDHPFDALNNAYQPGQLSEKEKLLVGYAIAISMQHHFSMELFGHDLVKAGLSRKMLEELNEVCSSTMNAIDFLKKKS